MREQFPLASELRLMHPASLPQKSPLHAHAGPVVFCQWPTSLCACTAIAEERGSTRPEDPCAAVTTRLSRRSWARARRSVRRAPCAARSRL